MNEAEKKALHEKLERLNINFRDVSNDAKYSAKNYREQLKEIKESINEVLNELRGEEDPKKKTKDE